MISSVVRTVLVYLAVVGAMRLMGRGPLGGVEPAWRGAARTARAHR